jgi:hypothetical protein
VFAQYRGAALHLALRVLNGLQSPARPYSSGYPFSPAPAPTGTPTSCSTIAWSARRNSARCQILQTDLRSRVTFADAGPRGADRTENANRPNGTGV